MTVTTSRGLIFEVRFHSGLELGSADMIPDNIGSQGNKSLTSQLSRRIITKQEEREECGSQGVAELGMGRT